MEICKLNVWETALWDICVHGEIPKIHGEMELTDAKFPRTFGSSFVRICVSLSDLLMNNFHIIKFNSFSTEVLKFFQVLIIKLYRNSVFPRIPYGSFVVKFCFHLLTLAPTFCFLLHIFFIVSECYIKVVM